MKIRQMIPSCLSILSALFVGTFYFCISKSSKLNSTPLLPPQPFTLSLCLQSTDLQDKQNTFTPINTDILFLCKIF